MDISCSARVYVSGPGCPVSLAEVLPAENLPKTAVDGESGVEEQRRDGRDGRDDHDALSNVSGGLNVMEIDSLPCEDGRNDPSTFSASEYFRLLLDGNPISAVLLTSTQTKSTQSSLQKRAGLLRDGTVFVADKQLGGRGRGSNVWSSPDGCLMFSMSTKYPGDGLTLPFVQYVVSLAVVQTIEAISGDVLRGHIKIKWPNDIYFKDGDDADRPNVDESGAEAAGGSRFLKIGGILCHSAFKQGGFFMTIGVGLNVDNPEPTTCLNDLMREFGSRASFTREALVAGIVRRVQCMLPALGRSGFGDFKAAYYRAWLHTGQLVRVQEDDETRLVRIVGLADNGYLMASDDADSSFYELSPDGNSLDFLAGLVAKKIS